MKIKTSELSGVALRWAVSTALGHQPLLNMHSHGRTWDGWWESRPYANASNEYRQLPRYEEDWAQGGPIIEREGIITNRLLGGMLGGLWLAAKRNDGGDSFLCDEHGPTVLIATMRCFVASRLGDEVDVPEELL